MDRYKLRSYLKSRVRVRGVVCVDRWRSRRFDYAVCAVPVDDVVLVCHAGNPWVREHVRTTPLVAQREYGPEIAADSLRKNTHQQEISLYNTVG